MSFFSTIKGFTRGSRKKQQGTNQKYVEPDLINDSTPSIANQGSIYSGNNMSNTSLKKTQSPSKQSIRSNKYTPSTQQSQQPPNRQQNTSNSQVFQNHGQFQVQQHHTQEIVNQPLPLFMCEPFIKTALVKGSYKTIVQIPKYVDHNEWLALNVFEFYNHLNKFYGVIAEYVTPERYPTMNADSRTEYVWMTTPTRSVSLPANQYIEYALTWISNKINDQSIFPTKSGMAFPPSFSKDIKGICRQMFRIIAHIYWNHFEKLVHLSLEAHWISYFSHFISFIREFDLLEAKELEPLAMLIENLEQQGRIIKVEK
ncbi:hypothetical protein CANINC_001709 [Pichia inconspicua]|uniref:Mob1/phocein family protein n=1 Tax=Pichia inconspicua TaxID=52247 RepID=A0A4T0X304_9ASCO|nr:hypothetical protein CANINC_001709 [[Candida] inconspicua]